MGRDQMKMSSRLMAATAALVGAVIQAPAASELINGIQAIVDETVITRRDVEEETDPVAAQLERDYHDQPDVLQKKWMEAVRNNVDHLEERQLILHEFKTAGYNLSEKYIDDAVQAEVRSYGDRPTFIKTLEAKGTTLDQKRKHIRETIIERAMREKNVSSEIIVSPYKVQVYYQEHHEDYKLADRVKLRMIALNKAIDPDAPQARKMAEEILGKLKEGTQFEEMAKMYSEDRQHPAGGDQGWVEKGELRKELNDVAFSLKQGDCSSVIETPEACYLIKVEGASPAHYKPLSEVRDQIEKDLQDRERARLQKQWIDKLRKKTFVRLYD